MAYRRLSIDLLPVRYYALKAVENLNISSGHAINVP